MSASFTSLPALFFRRWSEPGWTNRVALADDAGSLAYGALADAVARLSGWMRQHGVRRGHYVGLAMERSTDQVLALLAALAAGACPCPLEPRLSAEETRRRAAAVGLGWLVYDQAHATLADASGLARRNLLAWPGPAVDASRYWDRSLAPTDAALLLFTSGSTGQPKGVLLNHRGVFCNAVGVAGHTGLRSDDRLLHVMPLHHTNAINNQLFAPLSAGAAVVVGGRFRAEDMPELMRRHAPTLLTGVPTMYARMLGLDFDRASLARLRFARCGSAPITETLHRRIEDFLGCPLVVSYGLSEATCTSTMNPPHARRIGTVGTVLPGQRVFLRRSDGSLASCGSEGEICIGGDNLMSGYVGVPDCGLDEGLLRTGDLGRFDADGYLSITGRIKDVIIRGGENISPSQIERVLAAVPGVAACAVVGGPHADLGEVPVAFVVAGNAAALDGARLRAAVQQSLGRIYVPDRFIPVDALPENTVGKVDRKALAARLRSTSDG